MQNEDALNEFVFDCQIRKLAKRTIQSYKNSNLRMMKFVREEYGFTEVEEMHYKVIQQYVQYLIQSGLSETYINRNIVCFKCFFKYCVEEGYIKVNPISKVKKVKEPVVLIETFTDDEVSRMIRVFKGRRFLDIRNQLIMVLLFDTGLRNAEVCGIKMSDLRGTSIQVIGKGNKMRYVPITPVINKYLIRYKRVRAEYIKDKIFYELDYLLLSQKGKRLTISTIENVVRDAGNLAKIKRSIRVSPHTCRHYYAQAQLKNGCDLYTLSKLLGHSNVNTTKRYLQSMHDDDLMELAVKTSPLERL